jgi:hypothetical protein
LPKGLDPIANHRHRFGQFEFLVKFAAIRNALLAAICRKLLSPDCFILPIPAALSVKVPYEISRLPSEEVLLQRNKWAASFCLSILYRAKK